MVIDDEAKAETAACLQLRWSITRTKKKEKQVEGKFGLPGTGDRQTLPWTRQWLRRLECICGCDVCDVGFAAVSAARVAWR